MSELVRKLAESIQPIEMVLRPKKNIQSFKAGIDRRYVHIKFPNTRGGTEVGVQLDPAATDLSRADLVNGTGEAKLVGGLTLDYVRVLCIADIDIATFAGKGQLHILQNQINQSRLPN